MRALVYHGPGEKNREDIPDPTPEADSDAAVRVDMTTMCGEHGEPATLQVESLWARDVTITTGLVDAYSAHTLLRLVASRQIDARRFATHQFALNEMLEADDTYGRATETGAVKVVLSR